MEHNGIEKTVYFGTFTPYDCYIWSLMERILKWEFMLTNKVDKHTKEYKVSTHELACLRGYEFAVDLSSHCTMIISAHLHCYVLTSSHPLPLV